MVAWQPEHAGLAVCCARRSRIVLPLVPLFSSGGTLAGGGGGSMHNSCARTNLPRRVGLVRLTLENADKKLAWVSSPKRCDPASETGKKSCPVGPETP